jgi:hypothetical protein
MNGFSDDTTKVMSAAFELAWAELQRVQPLFASPAVAEANRQRVASFILDFADDGISDPQQLKLLALECFFDSHKPKVRRPAPQYTGL